MKFKKRDQVKLIGNNLTNAGYNVDELLDTTFIIDHIYPKETFHHYKESLLNNGIYSKEQLSNKEVYLLDCHINDKSIIVSAIADDMILVQSYKPSPIKVSKDIINDILKAYVQFHTEYDLETNRGDILNDITNGKPNKRTLINIIDDVDELPCIDSLYDKHMTKRANEWLSNNEEFDLKEYVNKKF